MGVMLSRLGQSGHDAVAEDLLRLIDAHVPLAQCTIFSFDAQGRARTVAIGDRSRTLSLAHISDAYVSQFYRYDGIMDVMRQELAASQQADPAEPRILLHRQCGDDIAQAEYRRICYDLPQVAERLAILALYEGRRWFSVNLYRGLEHGPFDDAAIGIVESFAPLIVHAVRLHHTGQALDQDLSDWLLNRLAQRQPQLTKRDLDVVRCLMAGQGTQALADHLGLTVSSAQTYQKRVYRKLGVAGQRELLGLLMGPGA
jgi:DNA-binding CsgD family transcriptional regulator